MRLATVEAAGQEGVPFTTGLLVGIGETRAERVEALLAIHRLQEQYGHIQEVGAKRAAQPCGTGGSRLGGGW